MSFDKDDSGIFLVKDNCYNSKGILTVNPSANATRAMRACGSEL
jgi:hypothetical protein